VPASGAPVYREININQNTTVSEDLLPLPSGWKKKGRNNGMKEKERERKRGKK
jgi:hypothetical protein